ncbi:hypothetical protein [Burkholderia multivorans]|uniref:hypothetical protein n=1 Tax=Burkholderia multivorans TaxID=87883 RepID=UPI00057C5FFD|nr:hypothetical protein [Burkholderia multivorans]KHS10406.1 hypothetical protein BMD22_28425 [Burkholderia multivorans]MDR9230008.1 hypothetical protein [Burkholderia multivorans]HDR9474373.1 hypothetical protein [Burkholderia multivorans]HDR9480215.1 hypothetical protein [Burkholderia multivorans]
MKSMQVCATIGDAADSKVGVKEGQHPALYRGRSINHRLARGQSGATTGEFMFWSILAAVVVVTAIFGYNRGQRGQNGADFVKEFNELGATASNLYTGQWAKFTTANASSSGLFKNFATIVDAGGGVVTIKGGGTITVAPGQVQTANDAGQYTIAGVIDETCKKIITGVAGSAATMTLNGTTIKAFGGQLDPTASCLSTNNSIVVQRQ